MVLTMYQSDKNYFYQICNNGDCDRISKFKYQNNKTNTTNNTVKVGQEVTIIIKPYHKKIYVTGIVKRVLTKIKNHPRGTKVMLTDGTVGRIIK